jgi:hypothetical protein
MKLYWAIIMQSYTKPAAIANTYYLLSNHFESNGSCFNHLKQWHVFGSGTKDHPRSWTKITIGSFHSDAARSPGISTGEQWMQFAPYMAPLVELFIATRVSASSWLVRCFCSWCWCLFIQFQLWQLASFKTCYHSIFSGNLLMTSKQACIHLLLWTAHCLINVEAARLYGWLNSGNATCSLANLEVLNAKEAHSAPLTYWELEKSLVIFRNLLGVVLQTEHPLTLAFHELWQLIFYTWFMHCRAHLIPPILDMKATVHQILMQVYVLPNLPPLLYQLANPKKPTVSPPPNSGSSIPGLVPVGSLDGSSCSSGSGASTISGISTHTIPNPMQGTALINLHPIAALQTLVPHIFK